MLLNNFLATWSQDTIKGIVKDALFSYEKIMLLRTYLQTHHGISRRVIASLIDEWKIFVNGEKVENYKADLQNGDTLEVLSSFSETLDFQWEQSTNISLLAFNKPKGYTCSKSDPYNPTFYELLPSDFLKKYYYIGRLDKESRGLMLLTNTPELVHQFEHPSKEIEKTYLVQLNHPFDWSFKEKILRGISEWWELLRTKKLKKSDFWCLKITLNEWKKRHIRRIFKALGYKVLDLQRIRIDKYWVWSLLEGKWQELKL